MGKKSGIFAGVIALTLALLYQIPIYPPNYWAIDFKIFSIQNINFYFWGYVINGTTAFTQFIGQIPESLISILIWLMIFFVGLSSIMASTKKSNKTNSLRLFRINTLFLVLILSIYGAVIIFLLLNDLSIILDVIGLGYYLTILILVLNLVSLKQLKKE
ncbi:MAG: hypothetical protein ACXABO_04175 [Promethearchaeota archaeon]|jgi:hypothetical protein